MKIGKLALPTLALIAIFSLVSMDPAEAAEKPVCPDRYLRKGAAALSPEEINPRAVGEVSGFSFSCGLPEVDLSRGKIIYQCPILPIIYTNNEGELTLSNPSEMPIELVKARRLALSGDPESTEPGELTGALPKLLMPGYKQKNEEGVEVNPHLALTRAEGQLAQGWVVENQSAPQERLYPDSGDLEIDGTHAPDQTEPYWDVRPEGQEDELQVGDENYQMEGRFGEVAPLYDRYGLLAQALSFPTDDPLELPDADCSTETYDPRAIVPKAGEAWFRKAIWRAKETLGIKFEQIECDITDVSCNLEAVSPIPKTFTAHGDLDIQSRVSLAGGAWGNMAGPSGAFAVLLPPETIFDTEESDKPRVSFAHAGGVAGLFGLLWDAFDNAGTSILRIASLGNVGKAVDCVVYGLTAHPANARDQVCDEVLISGKFLGWPTLHGFIFQGPKASCANCTHSRVEAIDIGPGPDVDLGDPVLATHEGTVAAVGSDPVVYGNYVDIRSTDPDFPASTRYAHLSSVNVQPGQSVSPGYVIGAVGKTGMKGKTGIHLHYEFRDANLTINSPVDMAYPFIPEDGGGAIRGCLFPSCPEIRW